MILPYIIRVALILGACLAFYKVLLRRETFYGVNRYMLIVCLVISFALPLVHVPQQFSLRKKEKEPASVILNPILIETDQPEQKTSDTKAVVQTPPTPNNSTQSVTTKFSFAQLMI